MLIRRFSNIVVTETEIAPCLEAGAGGGGNNLPMIVFRKSRRAKSKDDYETWVQTEVANTLNTFDGGGVQEQQL